MSDGDGSDADDRLAALEDRLEAIEADFEDKLDDVRDRVVQVKRETDEKAAVDHDHDELLDRIEDLQEGPETEFIEQIESTIEAHTERIDAIEEKVEMLAASALDTQDRVEELADQGYAPEGRADAIAEMEETVDTLASTVLDLREDLDRIVGDRNELADLLRRANQVGVRKARCSDCTTTVDVSLLTAPTCPDCGATFVDVESGGLLGSGELQTESAGRVSPDANQAFTDAGDTDGRRPGGSAPERPSDDS